MLGFELTGTTASVAMLIIVSITFVLFIREKHPPEVIAIASAAAVASSRRLAFATGSPVRSATMVWKFSSASSRPCAISG